MVQDVPNLRENIQRRALRPLWVLAAVGALGIAILYAFSGPGNRFVEPIRRSSMIQAAELFADGRADAALSHVNAEELSGAPEGALLRAVIHYYHPSETKLETIEAWLREAAEANLPGADTMLGWVLVRQPDCVSCLKQAAHWFEHALAGRADREARLGLAAALTQLTRELSMPRAHYDALLAENVEDSMRLQALTLRGSVEPSATLAAAYTEEAALQGFAEAQYRLWKRYLPRASDARVWLAMAALQGHDDAIHELQT